MTSTTLKTRIKLKNGTPEEWSQATNFSPLKGELVIYNDADNPRMKVGDGETNINDLPFVNNSVVAADSLGGIPAADYATKVYVDDAISNLDPSNNGEYLDINLEGAAEGELALTNADMLGGVPATEYALKTDTAPNSAKLGGKAPEYYIQPRNLLDNSDFTNPVNQRGKTSYTGTASAYTIDRWYASTAAVAINIISNGINVDNRTGTANGHMSQRISAVPDGAYTVFVKTSEGFLCRTFNIEDDALSLIDYTNTTNAFTGVAYSNDILQVQIGVFGGNVVTVYWAAVYHGLYTIDTMPPYVPKGYGVELVECLRYFRSQPTFNAVAIGANGMQMRVTLVFPEAPMRIIPSVVASSEAKAVINGTWFDTISVIVVNSSISHVTLGLNFDFADGVTANTAYLVELSLFLNADL